MKVNEIDLDLKEIVKQFKLPYQFPAPVIEEAKKVSKEKVNAKGRLDLRTKEIFTIDGDDAKDLDDAVCVDYNDDGTYTLGVHIADVSHYVKNGSALDVEAVFRGTSVYMFNRVIPMLPTELSNGCCSLNQHEDRYAISVIMKIDSKGEVIDSDIKKSVVCITKRMNYHDVTAILEKSNKKVLNDNKEYIDHFERMRDLANILKKRREKNGYLSLNIPETEIRYNKLGKPIEIGPYKTSISNEIIEQFMLTANEVVAERFYWLNAPFIYRVHENPSEDKISDLNKALFSFGYMIKGKKSDVKPKAFSQILEKVSGTKEERVVSQLLLRTLKIARYESENKGHFGIASKYYCHFTSPIRRYPDLFIHRVISKYLEDDYNVSEKFIEKYKIKAIKYSERSSECEQNATKAEREADSMKMAEYMESKIGKRYKGIVSSITEFGMFVELDNTVEGLVHFDDMGEDYYIYNEANKTLMGKHSKRIFKLGDKVSVEVVKASKKHRWIDFKLIEKNNKKIIKKSHKKNIRKK